MKQKQEHIPAFENLEQRLLMSGTAVLGNLAESATQIDIQTAGATSISDQILSPSNMKLYEFTSQARGRMTIDMGADQSGIDSYLQVFNNSGRRIKLNDNLSRQTNDSQARLSVRAGQTYYVMASASQETYGNYTLTLTSQPVDDYSNNLESPKQLRLNSRGASRRSGTINYATDADVFQVEANITGQMRVNLSRSGRRNALNCNISAYDANAQLIAQSSWSGTEEIAFDVVAGQVYYLRAASNASSGRYRLNILPTLAADFVTATEVDLPSWGSVEASGSITAGSSDAYKFTVGARGRVQIQMNANDGQLSPYLEVFNSDGRRLRAHSSSIRLGVREGQTFYVRASGNDNSAGQYTLTFTAQPNDDVGNSLATSKQKRLRRRGSTRFTGKINYSDDVDVFSLVASKSGSMLVDMEARGRRNNLDCEIFAYSADGTLLAQNDDQTGSTNSQISFDVQQGQTYYIKTASTDGSGGAYLVNIVTNDAQPPEMTPEQTLATYVSSVAGGLRLSVVGTDNAETITLSQRADSITLTTASGSFVYDGLFSRVVVYGFGGQDVIRLDNSVFASGVIYAGSGNDTIYEAGTGNASIYGQAGDDLLVSIGGGSDLIFGDNGFDSFWADGSDTISDASTAELSGRSVHQIDEFYQPYSDNPQNSDYVSLEIAGQNFRDPTITSYARGYANFAHKPLFVEGPEYDDIVQGYVGDCYYLASLASLADTDPQTITQMIAPMGDGTYAVRFFNGSSEVFLRIDADLPVRSGSNLTYARFGPDGELWVPLAEKAYAYFRYGENSYASISGGWMSTVYRQITGGYTRSRWTSGSTDSLFNYITENIENDHAITLGSYSNASSPIVGSHAYVVKSAELVGSQQLVTVYNPWGVDGRSYDSNYSDGLLTLTIDQIQTNFSALAVSLA